MPNKASNRKPTIQRISLLSLCIVFSCSVLIGCHQKQTTNLNSVKFNRFEELIFSTPTDQLQSELIKNRNTFDSPLLNIAPDNSDFMTLLIGFASDSIMRSIYHTTDSLYHDLSQLESTLNKALQRTAKISSEIHYNQFYTLITGDYHDYQNRIFCDDHSIAISIDHYALPYLSQYQYFGTPAYLLSLLTPEHLAADCMAAIARAHIALPNAELTLLDYAIAEGKALYFVEQTLPSCPDTIRFRYSAQQLAWIEASVEQVWGWLIQNQLLFSTDLNQFHNLIDDAPKTNAFGEGSAPRTPAYIGYQIVKRYMKKSSSSIDQLFALTDSQRILTESGWRP